MLSDLLNNRPDRIKTIALRTREAVVALCEPLTELVYNTYAVSVALSYSGRLSEAFIHVATYKNHVNLGFNKGAQLKDPSGLLKGSGKIIRHVRIDDAAVLSAPELIALIKQAEQFGMEAALRHGSLPEAAVKLMSKSK